MLENPKPPSRANHDIHWKHFYTVELLFNEPLYTALSRKVVGKKIKVYATRPKGSLGIHWNFAYWPKGNLQVWFFARGKFVFPLRGLYL